VSLETTAATVPNLLESIHTAMRHKDGAGVRCLQTAVGAVPDSAHLPEDLLAIVGRSY
jgi:hypothetical protein